MPRPVRLFASSIPSGNAYKVELLLSQLGIKIPIETLDILANPSETRRPEFLARNPNGRIPLLELDDGTHLPESNAILWWLAQGTPFWPGDPLDGARALQWMFFEQYSHEPYIAVARFWKHYLPKLTPLQEMDLPERMTKGYAALGVMEQHLARHRFFVDERFGLADIALYAYTHVAGEGGFNLDNFPHVNAWLARVANQPGHVTISHRN